MIILYAAGFALDWDEMPFTLWEYMACNDSVLFVGTLEDLLA